MPGRTSRRLWRRCACERLQEVGPADDTHDFAGPHDRDAFDSMPLQEAGDFVQGRVVAGCDDVAGHHVSHFDGVGSHVIVGSRAFTDQKRSYGPGHQ